jgi:TRAP-type C4-dicarboxylate transport system permease small subunit
MKALGRTFFGLTVVNDMSMRLCSLAVIVLMFAIAAVVSAGVFWRYFLNDALSWTEETAKFLMVWLVFAGAPIALRKCGHASINILPDMLPPRLRQGLFALIYLMVIGFLVVLIDQGSAFALQARNQTTATTNISMLYIFSAMPIGGVIMLAVAIELTLRSIVGVFNPAAGLNYDDMDRAGRSGEIGRAGEIGRSSE